MNKCVIILGNGYIGNYLNNHLKRNFSGDILFVSKKHLNYTNPNVFRNFLNETSLKYKISYVINCSGYTGSPNVDSCEDNKDECYFYNVTAPLYITKECNHFNIPIIHIASGCIYSGYDKIYTEDDIPNFGCDSIESSFYSKTKDTFERLSNNFNRYIFRIRIPFNSNIEPKNYLYKLLNYDNLISKPNSLTCVDDLMVFISNFIKSETRHPYGIYNVVNKGYMDSSEIVDIFKEFGTCNKNWKFVSIKDANFRANRSNCILSTNKIESIYMPLPDVKISIRNAVEKYCIRLLETL